MNEPSVVVVRQKQGPDIVGVLLTIKLNDTGTGSYLIEHPYVPIIQNSGELTMMPYCVLSDQTVYEFPVNDTKFMTPAKDELAEEYLAGLARKNAMSLFDPDEFKAQKVAFNNALETLQISPTVETLQ